MRLLFLDTETGGLDPLTHPIVSLGALVVELDDGSDVAAREWLICDPDLDKAEKAAMLVHGIEESVIRTQGNGPLTCWIDFLHFVREHCGTSPHQFIPVGHNVPFDFGFIERLCRLAGFPDGRKAREGLLGRRPLDTLSLARTAQIFGALPFDHPCSLSGLSCTLVPELGAQTHGALDDCRRTKAIMERLLALIVRKISPPPVGVEWEPPAGVVPA